MDNSVRFYNKLAGNAFLAIPRIFSAGIDLSELHNPDPKRLSEMWRSTQDFALNVYSAEFVSTAAINGYTGAGACILSLLYDYRVMVNNSSKIGLNDTILGIVPAWWVCQIMTLAAGHRQGSIAITSSKMYTPDEAVKAQLVDEIAENKEDAIEKCKQFIRQYDNIPRHTLSAAKRRLREGPIRYLEENREIDLQNFLSSVMNSDTQQQLDSYVKQLKQKKVK